MQVFCVGCGIHQVGEKARHAQKAQPDHQHAGDGAAAKRHGQRGVDAVARRFRGAHVGAHRHVHADEARCAGQNRADGKTDRRLPAENNRDDYKQNHADHGDGAILTIEVSRSAFLNGGGDFLHARIARRLRHNPATRYHPVDHR